MSFIISGGAGFIGTNFIKNIISNGKKIFVLDNFSINNEHFLIPYKNDNLEIINCNLSNPEDTNSAIKKITELSNSEISIWHFAANSNIPSGISNPKIDLNNTFMTTFNLLESCKKYKIKNFNFASSSAIYGDHGKDSIKESTGPLIPISNYGAMKLASEAQCFASSESFLENLRIFRFPNVVGSPATHGVIFDFINKLKKDPNNLMVLGDGNQSKDYLHVDDLIDGMLFLSKYKLQHNESPIFNLGQNGKPVKVSWIAQKTVEFISPEAKITFENNKVGWLGDIPTFSYDTQKAKEAGWEAKMNSEKAIEKAIKEIYYQLN